MSRNAEGSFGGLFFIWSIIFCFATWGLWSHYRTVIGPTTLATVVSKSRKWHKGSYDHYLTIQFVHDGLKVATSKLAIEECHYVDFKPGDTFPIKYAKTSPEDTAFVGEPFYTTFGGIAYCIMVLILVGSFVGMRRENRPSSWPKHYPKPKKPAPYSPVVTLAWAALGVASFSGGIVSCRRAAHGMTTSAEAPAYEYARAKLLDAHYDAASDYTSALVQLPALGNKAPVRLSLSPEQHALLHAVLLRPHSSQPEVMVAYVATAPTQILLADAELPALRPAAQSTLFGIQYDTLGALLIVGGMVLTAGYLIKYTNHKDD